MSDQPPNGRVGVPRPPRPSAGDRVADETDRRPPRSPAPRIVLRRDGESRFDDTEQTLADSDQTLSDADQTSADSDQTSADRDQTSADREQQAADHDQAASDRDLASGGSPSVHEASRDVREHSADERDHSADQRTQTAQARLEAAERRDAIADARDVAALARDQAAAARDLAMAQRDASNEQALGVRALTGADVIIRAAGQRKRAAAHRTRAAEQRVSAAQDRKEAAEDRERAARERRQALLDREAFARQLEIAETDPLTGARTRAAGLTDLDRELSRCIRTGGALVVAYIDVVGLKTLNDTESHGAGDELLERVVTLVRAQLRSYDLIIRLGGDEFLCAMSGATLADARRRFRAIAAALAEAPGAGAIRTGFAQLTPNETVPELIARADGELVSRRRAGRDERTGAA